MHTLMEQLLHYVWRHRLFPLRPLTTQGGERVEVIDVGLPNPHDGPDFFNAKVKVGATYWAGNVEIHDRASDWFHHGHDRDPHYNNVVLHVVREADALALTQDGKRIPQLQLEVPAYVKANYAALFAEEKYPPCFRVLPDLTTLQRTSWLAALAAERLEQKKARIDDYLRLTNRDWERSCFVALARNFGFGVNAEAFERWALNIPLSAVGKHRDNAFQVEAFFFGQAGLLDPQATPQERQDDYFRSLADEYRFLRHKFSLTPLPHDLWRFLRLRPQNFPHVRIAQLVNLYHSNQVNLSRLLEAASAADLRTLLQTSVTPYWETHYTFGLPSKAGRKALQTSALDLLLINTAVPLLFAFGRSHRDERMCERALRLMESVAPERNSIVKAWADVGLKARSAAESQALLRLKRDYCQRKACLDCRFGAAYLQMGAPDAAGAQLDQ